MFYPSSDIVVYADPNHLCINVETYGLMTEIIWNLPSKGKEDNRSP